MIPVATHISNRGIMPKPLTAITTAAEFLPDKLTLDATREASKGCTACHLYKLGTQTVFGEGPRTARVVMVGEQPGDQEDIEGRPFVGPAGKLLDRALADAGIERNDVYLTNVVKHFKWKPRGKRRIHEKPNSAEITACRPWLEAELTILDPEVLVLLGATAAQAIMGKQFRVTADRGKWLATELKSKVIATIHPSAILRAPDPATRELQYKEFVADMAIVVKELE